jgi:hypothetical protein
LPLPSALSAPAAAKKLAESAELLLVMSVPAKENTYVPLKFESVKPPLGGAVAVCELLPQPLKKVKIEIAASETIVLRTDMDFPLRELRSRSEPMSIQSTWMRG